MSGTTNTLIKLSETIAEGNRESALIQLHQLNEAYQATVYELLHDEPYAKRPVLMLIIFSNLNRYCYGSTFHAITQHYCSPGRIAIDVYLFAILTTGGPYSCAHFGAWLHAYWSHERTWYLLHKEEPKAPDQSKQQPIITLHRASFVWMPRVI